MNALNWLLRCSLYYVEKLKEILDPVTGECQLSMCLKRLETILGSTKNRALIHIAKLEEPGMLERPFLVTVKLFFTALTFYSLVHVAFSPFTLRKGKANQVFSWFLYFLLVHWGIQEFRYSLLILAPTRGLDTCKQILSQPLVKLPFYPECLGFLLVSSDGWHIFLNSAKQSQRFSSSVDVNHNSLLHCCLS